MTVRRAAGPRAIVTPPDGHRLAPAAAPSATRRAPRTVLRLLPGRGDGRGRRRPAAPRLRPAYLNYDARYALLWARDISRGLTPDYTADFAPTPHPLETAVSSLALPFGDGADQVVLWLVLLCFGALVWLTYRLGAELFSPWVGRRSPRSSCSTRPALQRDALLGYQDTAVRGARSSAPCCSRRGGRGAASPCSALLAVAGLLRPEAWVLRRAVRALLWPRADGRRRARLLRAGGRRAGALGGRATGS